MLVFKVLITWRNIVLRFWDRWTIHLCCLPYVTKHQYTLYSTLPIKHRPL